MLRAVIEDFSRLPQVHVVTTLDHRLIEPAREIADRAEIHWAGSSGEEQNLFRRLAAEADATFVIAPETGGCLAERRQMVDTAGGRFLGHSADAIDICADKYRFFGHLLSHQLPAIPTARFTDFGEEFPFPYPVVVKPRDGAGSQNTFLIQDRPAFEANRQTLGAVFVSGTCDAIVQPYVDGQNLSVSAVADGDSGSIEVFPIGEQKLSDDGRFQYQGGRIPARLDSATLATELRELISATCNSIPGLSGYIGFDLLLPRQSANPVIVEANPRLTTSYLGYRRSRSTTSQPASFNPVPRGTLSLGTQPASNSTARATRVWSADKL